MTVRAAEKRPRLILGVTGHRVLAEVDRVREGVAAALAHIEQTFPGRKLTIVSALAEGADRIVVQEALKKPGAELEVILPMPRADYLRDFSTRESRREFEELMGRGRILRELSLRAERAACYKEAGSSILERSHVVLAVWDGKPEQGLGGTGAIVALARAKGLPIVWIHAGNRVPGTLEPTSLDSAQGGVTFEGF
jgi:hypothetical protein